LSEEERVEWQALWSKLEGLLQDAAFPIDPFAP